MLPGLSTGGGGFSASESDSSSIAGRFEFGDAVNNSGALFASRPPDYMPLALAAVAIVAAVYIFKK